MKVVIDIPEEQYEIIKELVKKQNSVCPEADSAEKIILNGTPLPKGHGRLIDYSWVVNNVINKLGIKDERYLLEAEKALMSIVEIAPTIIEADDES